MNVETGGVRRDALRHARHRRRHLRATVDVGSSRSFSARPPGPGASPLFVRGPSSSARPACSTGGGSRRTGCTRGSYRPNSRNARPIRTASSSTTARSGRRRDERRHRPRARLIEADLGHEVTKEIAKKLVLYHRRAGGQSQFSTCSTSTRSRTASRRPSLTPSRTSTARSRSRSWRRPPISARASSAASSMPRPASRRPRRSRTYASRPRGVDGAQPAIHRRRCRPDRLRGSQPHAPGLPPRVRAAAAGHPAQCAWRRKPGECVAEAVHDCPHRRRSALHVCFRVKNERE